MTPPRDGVADLAGRRMPYRDWGDPSAPAVVVLHGLFGNSREWDTVAERLAADRRVVVPDQRGHGAAEWADDYTAGALVADLAALVDVLDLAAFDLVGHSMGGVVAMLYASGNAHRVRRLVIVDIGPDTLSDRENRDGFLQMLDALGEATYGAPAEVVDGWLEGDPFARRPETERWARHALRQRADGRWVWRVDTAGIGEFLTRRPDARELWSALARVTAPTLVVHGEHSWALSKECAREMARTLADGQAIQVDAVGHDLGVQAPHVVATHVASFLTTLRAA